MYLQNNFEFFKPSLNLRRGVGRDQLMMNISLDMRKNITIYSKIILEWNELPLQLRSITETETFKKRLKAHFFKIAFANFL